MTMRLEYLIAALAGLASHVGYFRRGEHHLYASLYVEAFALTVAAAVGFLVYGQGDDVRLASSQVSCLAAAYLCGLYGSLLVYRILLHPLNKFPGPVGYRMSSVRLSSQLFKRDAFRHFQNLHKRYGPFVRVGPSELSIAHPEGVNLIYGQGSKCTKAAWYDLTKPITSLQTYRKKALHDRRRRVWSSAFSDRGLRGYEQRIEVHRRKLISHIRSLDGKPINMTKWFNLYSFDVMGDLAFGRSFDMLETSQEHWAIQLLNDGIKPLGFFLPMWFFRLMTSVPGLTKDWWRFINFCSERIQQRLKTKQTIPDIASAILAPLKGKKLTKDDLNLLTGDSQLIVVAGSDTTATTMASVLYELVRHPQQIDKLRQELAPYKADHPAGELLNEKIANLNHLNGVINETLRLHPPVPTALHRKTPPEGIEIDGTYIPGNMTVWCPQYVLGRDENCYFKPESFIPERWYQFPDMVKKKSAFAPFSQGPYGCIGRPLALLNIRTTLAQLIMAFDIALAPGEDGSKFEGNATEQFTISKGELNIVFKRRS